MDSTTLLLCSKSPQRSKRSILDWFCLESVSGTDPGASFLRLTTEQLKVADATDN